MNNVSLIGNLATDVELRDVSEDKKVAGFLLAVNRGSRDAGADLAHERLAEDTEAARDDEPAVLGLVYRGVPPLAFEHLRHRRGGDTRRQEDEMADSRRPAWVAAQVVKALEHPGVGGGRVLHQLHLFHVVTPYRTYPRRSFCPGGGVG